MSGDHRVLTRIEFVGNATIPSDELKGKIATRETSGLVEKDVRYFDRDLFEVDELRIVRWYNTRGFYRAKVTDVDEVPDSQGRVKVVVHVEEGIRAVVRAIDFDGASTLAD